MPMVATYYIKLPCTGTDRHNGFLISLLLLVAETKNSLCKKLLGINFDYKLNFAKPIEDICQKALRKLNALARLAP